MLNRDSKRKQEQRISTLLWMVLLCDRIKSLSISTWTPRPLKSLVSVCLTVRNMSSLLHTILQHRKVQIKTIGGFMVTYWKFSMLPNLPFCADKSVSKVRLSGVRVIREVSTLCVIFFFFWFPLLSVTVIYFSRCLSALITLFCVFLHHYVEFFWASCQSLPHIHSVLTLQNHLISILVLLFQSFCHI